MAARFRVEIKPVAPALSGGQWDWEVWVFDDANATHQVELVSGGRGVADGVGRTMVKDYTKNAAWMAAFKRAWEKMTNTPMIELEPSDRAWVLVSARRHMLQGQTPQNAAGMLGRPRKVNPGRPGETVKESPGPGGLVIRRYGFPGFEATWGVFDPKTGKEARGWGSKALAVNYAGLVARSKGNPVLSGAPAIESMEVVYKSKPWQALTENGWVTQEVKGTKAIMLPPRGNPGRAWHKLMLEAEEAREAVAEREGSEIGMRHHGGSAWAHSMSMAAGDLKAAKLGMSKAAMEDIAKARAMGIPKYARNPRMKGGSPKIKTSKRVYADLAAFRAERVASPMGKIMQKRLGLKNPGTAYHKQWAEFYEKLARTEPAGRRKTWFEAEADAHRNSISAIKYGVQGNPCVDPVGGAYMAGDAKRLKPIPGKGSKPQDQSDKFQKMYRDEIGKRGKKNPGVRYHEANEREITAIAGKCEPGSVEQAFYRGAAAAHYDSAFDVKKFRRQAKMRSYQRTTDEVGARIRATRGEKNPGDPAQADIEKIKGFKPEMLQHPDFMPALKKYIEFHGCMPESLTKVSINLGAAAKGDTTFLAHMGKAPEVSYQTTNPKSNKAGSRWIHEFCEDMKKKDVKPSDMPDLACTADGKAMVIVGGRYQVKDWVRK